MNPAAPTPPSAAPTPPSAAPTPPSAASAQAGVAPRRPRSAVNGGLVAGATLALIPAVAATLLRLFPPTGNGLARVAAFIPYGLLGYGLALILLLLALIGGKRRLALGGMIGCVSLLTCCALAWQAPVFVSDERAATGPGFTLMSLNIYKGLADPSAVARAATQADVVILIEATPAAVKALNAYGWRERFPYAVGDLDTSITDTVVYSRFPLTEGALIGRTTFQQWSMTLSPPGLAPLALIAVHPCNPFCEADRWRSEHAVLHSVAAAELHRPLVVAGDFNAVADHGPMQSLRRLGLRSATDITGAGWLPTWPSGRSVPPLLALDHVMLNDRLTATDVAAFTVPGTDHKGLLVTIAPAA